MPESRETTPMFRQYAKHKAKHRDAVLFFRMGDFYEMFKTDAIEVSRLLNLTLTQRQGIPMCGIPYHAAGNYIARLLKAGKKIAICEQIELPQNGKGLAKREVVEVVTPGTVVDDSYLDEKSNNYLAALAQIGSMMAFCFVDLSTGEFRCTQFSQDNGRDAVRRELARTSPRELIIQESLLESDDMRFLSEQNLVLNRIPDWAFDPASAAQRLKKQFATVNLKAFSLSEHDARTAVAGVILEYLEEKHQRLLPHIQNISVYGEDDAVGLDEATIRNLELVRNLQDGGSLFTLLHTLDHTKTAPGARLLRRRLLQPFPDVKRSSVYHDKVEQLYRNQGMLSALREKLASVLDLERLAARTAMDRAHAKDLLAIRDSVARAIEIRGLVPDDILTESSGTIGPLFESLARLHSLLERSISDDPSILFTEGRLLRDGWDSQVDEMRLLRKDSKAFLDKYVAEEKAATGIQSLKLKYNRILGYFLEISKSQAEKAPERFRRRQSLTGAERFSTARLEEIEDELNTVAESLVERERELFFKVRDDVKAVVPQLMSIAALLAELDVAQGFAHAATEYGYVRPKMVQAAHTVIEGGRHPVVERHLPQGAFVPNSITLKDSEVFFALVTGPNMAGKSTVLRQVALITLMAQAGSFVPADSAVIGVADRIFCRVGASDNLARGESTFLVEMNETANILRNAGPGSLIIMDEVGRGTGTADGLAIAQAVCDYLLSTIRARTLFATHYRELTLIEHPGLRNLSMAVQEIGDTIVFPKNLIPGPAEASYGIHVAGLAGLPAEVVNRARTLLVQETPGPIPVKNTPTQKSLFDPKEMVADAIIDADINNLTPMSALKLIEQWQKELANSS